MSVISVTELRGSRAGVRAKTAGAVSQANYTATRVFGVDVSSVLDEPVRSEVAPGIPRLGDPHPADSGRRVASVSSAADAVSELRHIVTIEYSSEVNEINPDVGDGGAGGDGGSGGGGGGSGGSGGGGGGGGSTLTELEPPQIRWEQETIVVPTYVINGAPITNSAGQTFDPPIQQEFVIPVLTITQNKTNFSISEATAVTGAVSADFFFGPPGTAQVVSRTGEKAYKNNTSFWRVTTRIRFRPVDTEGRSQWGTYILDQGTMENAYGDILTPIYLEGERVTSPVGLKNGLYSPAPDILYVPPPVTANFGGLGLPSF